MLGAFHAIFGIVSLVSGGWSLLNPKGTFAHIKTGWVYVASMVCLNISALCIYRLTGRFNFFHALAMTSLIMVLAGVLQVRFRHRFRKWLWRHYQYMSWSFVGLVAATGNEAFTRLSVLQYVMSRTTHLMPLLFSFATLLISAVIIFSRQRHMLARYGTRANPAVLIPERN